MQCHTPRFITKHPDLFQRPRSRPCIPIPFKTTQPDSLQDHMHVDSFQHHTHRFLSTLHASIKTMHPEMPSKKHTLPQFFIRSLLKTPFFFKSCLEDFHLDVVDTCPCHSITGKYEGMNALVRKYEQIGIESLSSTKYKK